MPGAEPFSNQVEQKLLALFGGNEMELQAARRLLATYGEERWHREQNRVRLAILKLSGKSISNIEPWVRRAKEDYRDALANAEFPEQMKSLSSTPEMLERDRKQYLDWLNS
jgi:hypothetical protein